MAGPGITDEARCAEESTVWLAVSTQVVCLENVMDDFCRERSNRSHEGGRGRTQCSSLYLYHQTQLKQTSVVNPNQTGRAVIFLDSDTVHSPSSLGYPLAEGGPPQFTIHHKCLDKILSLCLTFLYRLPCHQCGINVPF